MAEIKVPKKPKEKEKKPTVSKDKVVSAYSEEGVLRNRKRRNLDIALTVVGAAMLVILVVTFVLLIFSGVLHI